MAASKRDQGQRAAVLLKGTLARLFAMGFFPFWAFTLLGAQPDVTLNVCLEVRNPPGANPPKSCVTDSFSAFLENIDNARMHICGEDGNDGNCEGQDGFIFARVSPGRYRLAIKGVDIGATEAEVLATNKDILWIAGCGVIEIQSGTSSTPTLKIDLEQVLGPRGARLAINRSLVFDTPDNPDRFLRAGIQCDGCDRQAIRLSNQLLDSCTVGDLPRFSERDLNNLLALSPYVTPIDGALGEAVSVSGQRSWFVHYDADGAEFSNLFFGGPLGGQLSLNTESVREFEVAAPGGTSSAQGFGQASIDVFRLQDLSFSGSEINRLKFLKPGHAASPRIQKNGIFSSLPDFRPAVPLVFSRSKRIMGLRPFGGGGNRHCRLEPCPYLFIDLLMGESGPGDDTVPSGGRGSTETFPGEEVTDSPRRSLEFFVKKTFLAPSPGEAPGRLTTAFQFARLGNPGASLISSQDARSPANDQLIFHTASWNNTLLSLDSHHEHRLWYSFAKERRLTLDGVFEPELGFFVPSVGSQADDNYTQLQVGDEVTLFQGNRLLQFGANFVYSRHRRRKLEERLRRATRLSNQSWAAFFQIREQLKPRLTLTAGLRWEGQRLARPLMSPRATAYGALLGKEIFPSNGRLPDQWNEWQPRLALAWSTAKGFLTLRGGVGQLFARQTMLTQLAALEGTGRVPLAAVQPDPADVVVFSQDYRNPRVRAAEFSVELRPTNHTVFSVDLRHSRGKHLTRFFDLNRSDEDQPLPGQEDPNYRLPQNGNQVIYTQPPLFPSLGELLVVESSARSRYKSITFSLRKFLGGDWRLPGGWLSRWQLNAYYTLSDDKDDDSSESHLSFRPFNRFDYAWDVAASDRDIRHRLDLFASGRITDPEKHWIWPDILTLRYQHRTSQPASFNPLNQKRLGKPCSPSNSATRVVAGKDCGRNHLRIGNRFSSFDWSLRWRLSGIEPRMFKFLPTDKLDSVVFNVEMLNTLNSDNVRRRQDLLQIPFLLDDVKQRRGLRVSLVFYLGPFKK